MSRQNGPRPEPTTVQRDRLHCPVCWLLARYADVAADEPSAEAEAERVAADPVLVLARGWTVSRSAPRHADPRSAQRWLVHSGAPWQAKYALRNAVDEWRTAHHAAMRREPERTPAADPGTEGRVCEDRTSRTRPHLDENRDGDAP